jgi:transcriptional/translational regulatory protein YebC/TACO1
LKEAGMEVISDELAMVPTTTVPLEDVSDARKILRLLEALDDHDDVQNVWSNFEAADEILEAAEA